MQTSPRSKARRKVRIEPQMDEVAERDKRQHDLGQSAREPPKKGGKKARTPMALQPRMDRTGGLSARKAVKTRNRRAR